MSCLAVIQARATSTRLPNKVCLPLGDRTLLDQVILRVARTPGVDAVCVAVPEGAAQQPVVEIASKHAGVRVVRGPEDDVLERTARAAELCEASRVLRVTSDCPLYDPAVGAELLHLQRALGVPFASTALDSGYPIGLDAEVVDAEALACARREADDPYEREHVTPWLWRRPERFRAVYLDRRPDRRAWRLAVDTAADFRVISALYEALGPAGEFGFGDVEDWIEKHPDLLAWNEHVEQTPYEW